jgi:hypothetical protein
LYYILSIRKQKENVMTNSIKTLGRTIVNLGKTTATAALVAGGIALTGSGLLYTGNNGLGEGMYKSDRLEAVGALTGIGAGVGATAGLMYGTGAGIAGALRRRKEETQSKQIAMNNPSYELTPERTNPKLSEDLRRVFQQQRIAAR